MSTPTKGQWSARAIPGATFALHVTPRARRISLSETPEGTFKASVTTAPEDGRATAAVAELLAHAPAGAQYVIKTHWGARQAKRLASMVKTSGIATEKEIKKAVKDIVDEKTKGAERYLAKAWKSLLTDDAMRALAAELAVEMPEQRRARGASVEKSHVAKRKRQSGRKR